MDDDNRPYTSYNRPSYHISSCSPAMQVKSDNSMFGPHIPEQDRRDFTPLKYEYGGRSIHTPDFVQKQAPGPACGQPLGPFGRGLARAAVPVRDVQPQEFRGVALAGDDGLQPVALVPAEELVSQLLDHGRLAAARRSPPERRERVWRLQGKPYVKDSGHRLPLLMLPGRTSLCQVCDRVRYYDARRRKVFTSSRYLRSSRVCGLTPRA